MTTQKFEYTFKFEDGTEKSFSLPLEEGTSLLKLPESGEPSPDWTALDHCKCPHCPYQANATPHCPVAKNLSRAADAFKNEKSHRKTTVLVKSQERFYGRQTDLQLGLQSLFGLIMATSDCPHMEFFRPMAKFHLPFSTLEETKNRVLGNYLVAQFELQQKGQPADFRAKELGRIFANVNVLNQHMIERIRSLSLGDADQNALVILDSFASHLARSSNAKK